MSDADRVAKAKDKPKDKATESRPGPAPTPAVQRSPAGPAWLGGAAAAPPAFAGVQRKVSIGEVGDPFERQAEHVAERVASGAGVAPDSIAHVMPGSLGVGQRAPAGSESASDEREREPQPDATTIQKAEKTRAKGEDPEKSLEEKIKDTPVQRSASPPSSPSPEPPVKREEPKGTAPSVQKADQSAKPPEKKEEPKGTAAPVQKAEKVRDKGKEPEKSLEQKVKDTPLQRAAAPASKPAASPGTKQPEKLKEAPVQRAVAGTDSLPGSDKEKKPAAPPPAVQKAATETERTKEPPRRPAGPAPVQAATKEEDPHRKQPKEEPPKHGLPLQRAPAAAGASAMEDAADRAIQRKDPGDPLPGATRDRLEHGLGVDLSDVRVHHDGAARDAARDLNARAFTHGSDVWLGHGESAQNVGLMAHEATHVVQQTGAVQRMLVQRSDKKSKGKAPDAPKTPADATATEDWDYEDKTGKVLKDKKIVLSSLKVPDIKQDVETAPKTFPYTLPRKTDEKRADTQREVWEAEAAKGTTLDEELKKRALPAEEGGKETVYLKVPHRDYYIIGDIPTVKQRLLRPMWDKDGKFKFFDVDHRFELQLGGQNTIENLWLLESEANQDSGAKIKAQRDAKIKDLLAKAAKKDKAKWKGDLPDPEIVRRNWEVCVEKFEGGLSIGGEPSKRYTLPEIRDEAVQLKALKALKEADVKKAGLRGTADTAVVYSNRFGGKRNPSSGWKGKGSKKVDWTFGRLVGINRLDWDPDARAGSVHVTAFKNNPIIEKIETDFDLESSPAVAFGGVVSSASIIQKLGKALNVKKASPVVLDQVELTDQGLVGRGRVLPDIPLIAKAELDLILDGDNIYIRRQFSAGDLNLPGPIKVTDATLEIFAGTQGLGATGIVLFEIDRVGRGKLTGQASTGEGLVIAGDFEFDTNLFQPAELHAKYANRKFSGSGKIGIPAGKVKGIRSAHLEVTLDDGVLDAKGSVKPALPGIEQADLAVHHSEKDGLVVAGHLELKKDIPGIAGGSVDATVIKKPGAEDYKVSAKGTATPKIPGISAQIGVSYDDGVFDIVGTVGYEKGMLKGAITVGATNRPMSAEGAPAGEPPGTAADKITLYGGGMLALRLAPWLEARATVRLLPNGEIEVTGRIGLPDVLEIFKEKKLDKNIFKVGIDIPIVGVSVLGQRIGIFANISGGLDLAAGIGPGQLQDLHLEVTYNPAHEEETHVVGAAALHIPARAGLRMFVRGSLGVGIPIVSASAGLEVGGALGLEGALDAAVNVDWTPVRGLDITASAEIFVEPKLKFDITGFVLVEADLLFSTIELYSQRWQLAAFEYGSGLRFGLKLPIHYQEGKPFDLSFSDVQFIVPDISASDVLSGLVKQIA